MRSRLSMQTLVEQGGTERDGNSNIEEGALSAWLTESGYRPGQISVALHRLRTGADNHSSGSPGPGVPNERWRR